MENSKRKIIAIVGPTASGKTGIGVRLAKEFSGEIISADSRQVYRGLDIGTGKDLADFGEVKYHMIDIVDPEEKLTLFDYLPLARAAIEDIFSRGKLPIIVGGTGLYIQALAEGFQLEPISNSEFLISKQIPNPKSQISKITREQLEQSTISELNNILSKLDQEKWKNVDKKNAHRLIRAIELAQEGLRPIKIKPDFEVLQIGLDIPRAELFERIDRRVDERFEVGMLEEVAVLLEKGVDPEWLKSLGLEYKKITEYVLSNKYYVLGDGSEKHDTKYLSHDTEFQAMSQNLKWKIHQFARRQLTWFRRFPEVNWLTDYKEIKRFVEIFLEH